MSQHNHLVRFVSFLHVLQALASVEGGFDAPCCAEFSSASRLDRFMESLLMASRPVGHEEALNEFRLLASTIQVLLGNAERFAIELPPVVLSSLLLELVAVGRKAVGGYCMKPPIQATTPLEARHCIARLIADWEVQA